MMARPVRLEQFDLSEVLSAPARLSAAEAEDLRLAAYEQGYAAGWDDAASAGRDEAIQAHAEATRALADLRLSYHSARAAVLEAVEPILREMIEKVLPKAAHAAIGMLVVEQMQPLVRKATGQPLQVTCAPAARAAIAALLESETELPVEIVTDEALTPGQAFLSSPAAELRLDLDDAVARIDEAIATFFHTERERETDE